MSLLSPDANRSALTVDVFRTIASIHEKTLLALLENLVKEHELNAIRRFFDLLLEDKSTGPLFENNTNVLETGLSFSKVLIHPLNSHAPMGDCDPQTWRQTQNDYFDHLMQALEGHPQRVAFLDRLLFDGASKIQDPRFFSAIAAADPIPFKNYGSALSSLRFTSAFAEAVANQNSAAAIAIAPLADQKSLSVFVDEVLCGRTGEDKDIRGQKCLEGLLGVGHRRHAVADAILPRLSTEEVTKLRLVMVNETLELGLKNQTPWDLEEIQRAAGGLGPQSPLAQASQRHAMEVLQPLRAFKGAEFGKAYKQRHAAMNDFAMTTARTAIQAHCTPVIEAMLPLVVWAPHTAAGNPLCNDSGVSLDSAISQGRFDNAESAGSIDTGRLRDTMAILMANGHSALDRSSSGATLLHVLGESDVTSPDWTVKLVQLLDLGLDATAVDHQGKLPTAEFQGDVEQWNTIVKTHGTRKRAWGVLDEIANVAATDLTP